MRRLVEWEGLGKQRVERVTASAYVRYHTAHGLAPVARPLQAIYVDRTAGNAPRNNETTGDINRPLTLTVRGEAVAIAVGPRLQIDTRWNQVDRRCSVKVR